MFGIIRKNVRRISEHVLDVRFIISHILIPLGFLSFYLVTSSLLLPAGVNKVFVSRLAKYVVPITIILLTVFFAVVGIRRIKLQFFGTIGEELAAGDLILLLLPLTPVMQYIINNDEILSLADSIQIFCVFLLLASVPIILVPILLRNTGAARPVLFLGIAFTFSITNMASLSKQFGWHEWVSIKILLPIFGGLWITSWIMDKFNFRRLLYILVTVFFLTNSLYQLIDRDSTNSIVDLDQSDNGIVALIDSRKPVVTPSIYLLVYDSYVINETMLAHGLDNRVQEQYLEDLNFKIYPHTYSVAATSVDSMSWTLNLSKNFYGKKRRGVSGDGLVQNLLEKFGYKTFGIFPSAYFFRGINPSYGSAFPRRGSMASLLVEAILEGEFRFNMGFNKVPREQFLQEKMSVFSAVSDDPRFIYMHSSIPGHTPNTGVCRPNEVALFGERLAKANLEMRQDIELIIENDPNSIVIVAGDHGPYLTKNCTATGEGDAYDISEISRLDIQDRFGSFLAIRWPSTEFKEYDDITVLQDLFAAIFAYIFEDPEFLEYKVEPISTYEFAISGAKIVDGVIVGGINNGEALFIKETEG